MAGRIERGGRESEKERVEEERVFSRRSLLFIVLRFVIPSLLFIQRPLARLLYNDLFFSASVLFSVSILALSSLLCLSPATDCSAQRAQKRRRREGEKGGREEGKRGEENHKTDEWGRDE